MKSKEIIETLTADVERLMQLHSSAMEEIAALREKSAEQSLKIRSLQEQLRESKSQLAKSSLQEAMIGGSTVAKAAAKAKINSLVREVEKCIAMVSNRI
jgi:division protein CdvB (Snf7/Vps24/ESCRT-III family)